MADPAEAVDALLGEAAFLPGLQRATPCEALLALVGDDPDLNLAEREALDLALLDWLKARRRAPDLLLQRPGGLHRFIRETGEGFRTAWRLKLRESSAWIRANLPDLDRWARNFEADATFDLDRAVLAAGAHLQQGKELHFLWRRVCEEAAAPRLRHRLDIALLGLVNLDRDHVPCPEVTGGLARWAASLPRDDRHKAEVVREWRALKAAFPRQPSFWRGRWENILKDDRYGRHPFCAWLEEADPVLKAPPRAVRREALLPKSVIGEIKTLQDRFAKEGLTDLLWRDMRALLDQTERYAEVTGQAYYLVTSCSNIARTILDAAPGRALALARRALSWSPTHGHSWSLRARALDRLGKPDLARAAYWEGLRVLPSSEAFYPDLARHLDDAEAEALLRKGLVLAPDHAHIAAELAQLLGRTGRLEEAVDLLAQAADEAGVYLRGCLLLAAGRFQEAEAALADYRRAFGDDRWTATLAKNIAAGPAGREDQLRHLRERERKFAVHPEDGGAELEAEMAAGEAMVRRGRLTEADLLLRLGAGKRTEALLRLDDALRRDDSDAYPQVIKALADAGYRQSLEGRMGRFGDVLALHLARTDAATPPEVWQRLSTRHVMERPLIGLVRLSHGTADEATRRDLADWAGGEASWDQDWDKYLRRQVGGYLQGGGEGLVPLPDLAHDAILQAVQAA